MASKLRVRCSPPCGGLHLWPQLLPLGVDVGQHGSQMRVPDACALHRVHFAASLSNLVSFVHEPVCMICLKMAAKFA